MRTEAEAVVADTANFALQADGDHGLRCVPDRVTPIPADGAGEGPEKAVSKSGVSGQLDVGGWSYLGCELPCRIEFSSQ
jgi:hypothetical protein